MKVFTFNFPCPHCQESNRAIIQRPGTYEKHFSKVVCFNAENQKGCKKEIEIKQQIHVTAGPTPEQMRIKQNEEINARAEKWIDPE